MLTSKQASNTFHFSHFSPRPSQARLGQARLTNPRTNPSLSSLFAPFSFFLCRSSCVSVSSGFSAPNLFLSLSLSFSPPHPCRSILLLRLYYGVHSSRAGVHYCCRGKAKYKDRVSPGPGEAKVNYLPTHEYTTYHCHDACLTTWKSSLFVTLVRGEAPAFPEIASFVVRFQTSPVSA